MEDWTNPRGRNRVKVETHGFETVVSSGVPKPVYCSENPRFPTFWWWKYKSAKMGGNESSPKSIHLPGQNDWVMVGAP